MKSIISVIIIAIMMSGCNGSASIKFGIVEVKSAAKKVQPTIANTIKFKVDGHQIETSPWSITRFKWSKDDNIHLNITSNMNDDKRTINLNLAASEPGNYIMEDISKSNRQSYGSYYPDYLGDITQSYSFSSGSFTITGLDTVNHIINATFSGTVKNLSGDAFEITDGEIINGFLNIGVINYK